MTAASDTTIIVFSPAVGLTAAEVATAWNRAPARAAQTPARVEQTSAEHYDPLVDAGYLVVSGIAINLLSSLIYDLIKEVFAEKRRPPLQVRVVAAPQPDGSTLLIVTPADDPEQPIS